MSSSESILWSVRGILILAVIAGTSATHATTQSTIVENKAPRPTKTPTLTRVLADRHRDPEAWQENPVGIENAYVIVGGDRIQIDILELPEYSGAYQVPIDGVIDLPLIDPVSIKGLTLAEASQVLGEKYNSVLKYPIVTIKLLSPSPLNVVVAGEVSNPGYLTVDLMGGVGSFPGIQYPTLTQALKQAGGVTLAADISQIQIGRRVGDQDRNLTVNIQDLVQTSNSSIDITIRDGDRIFVPTLKEVNLRELRQLAQLNLAADVNAGRTVAVVGQVNRPGSYHIRIGVPGVTASLPTVSLAIQSAGGIKPLADIRNIELHRQTKTGWLQVIQLDLWQLLQTGDINQDTVLQDGDAIVIPKAEGVSDAEATALATVSFAPDAIKVSVVGEVKNPGTISLPPNTPLNQALLTAGGLNGDRANRSEVQLLRLTSDGTVVSREIQIDLTQGIDEQSNPLLQNNDIIVVERSGVASVADTFNTVLSPASNVLSLVNIPLRIIEIMERLGVRFGPDDN